MDYDIRNVHIEDAPGLAKTQVDSYKTAYEGLLPPAYLANFTYAEQEQDWADILRAGTTDMLLVAVSQEKQVVGYVLTRAQPDIFPDYDAEIIALHVQKPFQKHGIGKALFRTAAKRLMDAGCKSTMLWTLKRNPTRQWYEKLGGIFLAEKSDEIDDWTISEMAYGWKDITSLLAILQVLR